MRSAKGLRQRLAKAMKPVRYSYHDLHITTAAMPRQRFSSLPYGYELTCTRVAGWQLWQHADVNGINAHKLIAGEFERQDRWLVLDVDGNVIMSSRP